MQKLCENEVEGNANVKVIERVNAKVKVNANMTVNVKVIGVLAE